MKDENLFTLLVLIGLTLGTALVVSLGEASSLRSVMVMALAGVKFYLVSFKFMELRKAHLFWKIATVMVGMFVLVLVGMVV
ncbi:MAG TPA: cytochrome C oxidase subunit IV family protein [Lunatimonas sp.]|nr:cytochrome C oxidase subunit IV family protein [Lunatimonas sp.]